MYISYIILTSKSHTPSRISLLSHLGAESLEGGLDGWVVGGQGVNNNLGELMNSKLRIGQNRGQGQGISLGTQPHSIVFQFQ